MSSQLKQKFAMIKRWSKMISGGTQVAVPQGPGRVYSKTEIKGYYNDMTGKVSPNTKCDSGGIPLCIMAGGETVYFPIAIFQYALGCYDLYLIENNIKHLESFNSCVNWAISNQQNNGSWDAFGLIGSAKYTVSSMAQGEGASLLLRAYVQSGEMKYYDAAKKAIDFMLTPVEAGGTAVFENNCVRLEEYPQMPRRTVLNGWIFSLFALIDFCLIDSSYDNVLDRTLKTMERDLLVYDMGFWSYYDLEKRVASPAYHDLHISLIHVLYDVTGSEIFSQYEKKFEIYQNGKLNKVRAVSRKIIQKIFEDSEPVVVQ